MIRKSIVFALVMVLVLSTAGCMNIKTAVELNIDNTGTLNMSVAMDEAAINEALAAEGYDMTAANTTSSTGFDIADELKNMGYAGVTITEKPVKQTINGATYTGDEYNMVFTDAEDFFSRLKEDGYSIVNLENGNKRFEYLLSDATETADETQLQQSLAILQSIKDMGGNMAMTFKTDYKVVSSNAGSVVNGVYTWNLLDMSLNAKPNDDIVAYVEYVPQKAATPEVVTARPTPSKVIVNGRIVAFDAYNINGNNYFKLRDVATAVNGTAKQFGVDYDELKKAINLISSSSYITVGGEMSKGDGTVKSGTLNIAPIYKDGSEVELKAYNINGNNYFKLRDLGAAFNIAITWDSAAKTVDIDTSAEYTAE